MNLITMLLLLRHAQTKSYFYITSPSIPSLRLSEPVIAMSDSFIVLQIGNLLLPRIQSFQSSLLTIDPSIVETFGFSRMLNEYD